MVEKIEAGHPIGAVHLSFNCPCSEDRVRANPPSVVCTDPMGCPLHRQAILNSFILLGSNLRYGQFSPGPSTFGINLGCLTSKVQSKSAHQYHGLRSRSPHLGRHWNFRNKLLGDRCHAIELSASISRDFDIARRRVPSFSADLAVITSATDLRRASGIHEEP